MHQNQRRRRRRRRRRKKLTLVANQETQDLSLQEVFNGGLEVEGSFLTREEGRENGKTRRKKSILFDYPKSYASQNLRLQFLVKGTEATPLIPFKTMAVRNHNQPSFMNKAVDGCLPHI
uniref:Uncharacterized protein n=1 Tax=Nelumbo nucifera TaxID=4432 RepID=A0A822ZG72_NELNU|nr:TPA_asm: hypothetical protein HUJ06_002107 [Nelumbo nucifera]